MRMHNQRTNIVECNPHTLLTGFTCSHEAAVHRQKQAFGFYVDYPFHDGNTTPPSLIA